MSDDDDPPKVRAITMQVPDSVQASSTAIRDTAISIAKRIVSDGDASALDPGTRRMSVRTNPDQHRLIARLARKCGVPEATLMAYVARALAGDPVEDEVRALLRVVRAAVRTWDKQQA